MRAKFFYSILVGTGAAALALLLWWAGLFDQPEYIAWKWRIGLFAKPGAATNRIKLILLDQDSIDWGDRQNGWSWPWPREVYAPIIDYCTRNGARAVIFDVLFTEPSLYGVGDDRTLAKAINRAPRFVAPLFLGKTTGGAHTWPPEIPYRGRIDLSGLESRLEAFFGKDLLMPRASFPIHEVATSSATLGSVSQQPDPDGVFRRTDVFQIFDGRAIPTLGVAAFLAGSDEPAKNVRSQPRLEKDSIEIAGTRIPLDDHGRVILCFRGPLGVYESFSAQSIIRSEVALRSGKDPVINNPQAFKDSYVFLGFTAPGLLDLRPTPLNKVSPGVEIYATMLDNILSEDFIRESHEAVNCLTIIVFALLSSVLIMAGRKGRHNALTVAGLLPAPALIGFAAYPLGYWWPIVVHEAAVSFSLLAGIILSHSLQGRQKTFIKNAFKHYLSPAVIERLLQDPSKLTLGGERRELTIFFSDLEGFSSISERLDPHTLTSLLNEYLSDMTDIILDEGGTLDKYEGDAIIAFWNAPATQPDHPGRACRAAMRCQRKLRERRDDFFRKAGGVLRARIGINTGEVVVGNMGSRTRFDYTVLGDAANLASRLEGANKFFGTSIMVSDSTWDRTEGEFPGRELGLIRVVGRKTPVRVYELACFYDDGKWEPEKFQRGLDLYQSRNWPEALRVFEELSPDPVAETYAANCRERLQNPEDQSECVWNLTGK